LRKTERIKDTNNYIKGEKYLILAEIYKGNAPWYWELFYLH